MRNLGSQFTNVSATAGQAFAVPIVARGSAFGDLNNDGQIDIVIGVLNESPVILRNNGTRNHWLGIKLTGSKSNLDGIGARVTIVDRAGRRQIFDVSTAGSYLSSSDPRVLVGLGSATSGQNIEIRWPSGTVQTVAFPAIDRYITVKERDASAR
jgi:hypothetical protein